MATESPDMGGEASLHLYRCGEISESSHQPEWLRVAGAGCFLLFLQNMSRRCAGDPAKSIDLPVKALPPAADLA